MRIRGKVSWYNQRDGFGQLIDDHGTRYFFDKSTLKKISAELIETGVEVEFQLNTRIQRPLCADSLKLLTAKKQNARPKQLTLFEDGDVKV